MMRRLASLGAGLALVALATSGCFTQPGDGTFGPANSLGGDENSSPALSLQASPARGPGPLDVEFSLSALDRDGGPLTWTLDFGDRTAPAAGSELPAKPRHTYTAPGAYVARFRVDGSEGEGFLSTISIVVLEGLLPEANATQGPEAPPEYSPPRRSGGGGGGSSSSQTTTNSSSNSTSATSSSTGPDGNSSASETSSSTSTSGEPTSSETSSSGSDTGTSSSTGTETFSDPGTSTSETSSTDPPPEPEPTTSESETSSDPPL